MDIKPYKGKFDYSYTLGAFPTYELIKTMPDKVIEVYCHSSYTDYENLCEMCKNNDIRLIQNDKIISKLSDKENVYVIGVFEKYSSHLEHGKQHLMLVNPGNMGNLGTIIRTALAFSIRNIAIISPGADVFNPKVVRASMGAVFNVNICYFDSYEDYRKCYINESEDIGRKCYSFMLTANQQLTVSNCPKPELFTLIFGNEAAGLPEEYADFTEPVIIPQSSYVDSLNLTIAAGIGMYMFTN